LRIFFSIILIFYTQLAGVTFCSEPTFEDEFEGTTLSNAWVATKNISYGGSASLFSPSNVNIRDGYLVISLNNIGTTDDDGVLYNATSGEVTSTIDFGYGKYEFRTFTSGLDPVTETLQILWDNGDYYKNHEFIGFEFQQAGFMSLFSTGVTEADEINAYHNTEIDSSQQPVALGLRPRFFTIEYLEDSVTWYYDNSAVRQEISTAKTLPTNKMRVVFRNWLIDQLKYNVTSKDMPVEYQIDYFKFTPVDKGGTSCKAIVIETEYDEIDNNIDLNSTDGSVPTTTISITELQKKIDGLSAGTNSLLGSSVKITNLSIFKSAKVVWVYIDGVWKGYSPYSKIRDVMTSYKIEIFTEIPAYTGFWIQK
jgi:hypothetical protein